MAGRQNVPVRSPARVWKVKCFWRTTAGNKETASTANGCCWGLRNVQVRLCFQAWSICSRFTGPNLCRWKTLIMLLPVWGRMTGLLMGKSKHIKDSQMILFFFNDFACSGTDGEWRAERKRERGKERERSCTEERERENATCWKISFGLIMINSECICSKTARSR